MVPFSLKYDSYFLWIVAESIKEREGKVFFNSVWTKNNQIKNI